MLKNVLIAKNILIDKGFSEVSGKRGDKVTIMKKDNTKAIINPNGSISINNELIDFRTVKRGKFNA